MRRASCYEGTSHLYQVDVAFGLLLTIQGLFAIACNGVLTCIYRTKGLHKPSNLVMLFITLSDVGGGVVGLYSGLYLLLAKRCWFNLWYLDDLLCNLIPSLWLCCCTGTTLLVPLISIVRFIAVYTPLKFHRLSRRSVILPILLTISLISLLSALYPVIVTRGGFIRFPTAIMCGFDLLQVSVTVSLVYGVFLCLLPILLSVITIIICNCGITWRLVTRGKFNTSGTYNTSKVSRDESELVKPPLLTPRLGVRGDDDLSNKRFIVVTDCVDHDNSNDNKEGAKLHGRFSGESDVFVESSVPARRVSGAVQTLQLMNCAFDKEDQSKRKERVRDASKVTSVSNSSSPSARRKTSRVPRIFSGSRIARPNISDQSKTVIFLSLAYLVCYVLRVFIYVLLVAHPSTPFHLLLKQYMSDEAALYTLNISDFCVTLNSFLNPLIYLGFSFTLRSDFFSVLLGRPKIQRGRSL